MSDQNERKARAHQLEFERQMPYVQSSVHEVKFWLTHKSSLVLEGKEPYYGPFSKLSSFCLKCECNYFKDDWPGNDLFITSLNSGAP